VPGIVYISVLWATLYETASIIIQAKSTRIELMNQLIILFTASLLLTACSTLNSIVSIDDKRYFSEQPKIVTKENRYFLRFRYSDYHFYMSTDSKIETNKLIFYIAGLTSTGDAKEKLQFEEIVSEEKIKLIKEGAVFWEEPSKKLVPLTIGDMKEDFAVVWNKRLKH
jgi:hypothetical protein